MTQRVATTPVNLKERIALLQQRATSGSPHASGGASASPSAPLTSSSSSSTTSSPAGGASASALRDRIAKFEEKGGVPVPRGSFGLGAPPPPPEYRHEGSGARKKGELYGNRIASVSRLTAAPGSTSPPSALKRHFTGNADVIAAASRSLVPSPSLGSAEVDEDSPVRKRRVSTSSLAGRRPASIADLSSSFAGLSGSFDEDDDIGVPLPVVKLFTSDATEAQPSLERSSSVSSADTMRSVADDSTDVTPITPDNSDNNVPLEPGHFAVPESLPSSNIDGDHDHTAENDHQQSGYKLGTDAIGENHGRAEGSSSEKAKEEVNQDREDECSIKTPVASSFSSSLVASPTAGQELTLDVSNEDCAPSDVSSLNTSSPSPYSGSLEVGERAFGERHSYVVVPSSSSKDATIANVLEQHDMQQNGAAPKADDTQEQINSQSESVSALDVSGANESRASTETVSIPSPSHVSLPTEAAEKSPAETQDSDPILSSRRRSPPAPLTIRQEKAYTEPSMDPKSAPKSFHAVVHGKQTQTTPAHPRTILPRMPAPRAQVVLVHPQAEPSTPGSPDLSALVAQAMYLEQRLMGGETDVKTPRPEVDTFQSAQRFESKSRSAGESSQSQIAFPPHSVNGNKAHDQVLSDAPAPPPKTLNLHTSSHAEAGSRKTWSWSSENASSEDSVPVLTPPPLAEEPESEHAALEPQEHADIERRQSIGSILSSPRKKVLSMFSRAGRSTTTLGLPDDASSDSTYVIDDSASFSVSVCASSNILPSPKDTTMPQVSELAIGPPRYNLPDVPRPVSMVSTASAQSVASPFNASEFIDSFPDVPRSVPTSFESERISDTGIEQRIGFESEGEKALSVESHSQSSPPPTPPSKSPVLLGKMAPSPPRMSLGSSSPPPLPPKAPQQQSQLQPESHTPPPPPSSPSPSPSTFSLARIKSKPVLRLPHLPYRTPNHHEREKSTSDASAYETHPPSSFFTSLSRSFSAQRSRARSRKNSTASRTSSEYETGS